MLGNQPSGILHRIFEQFSDKAENWQTASKRAQFSLKNGAHISNGGCRQGEGEPVLSNQSPWRTLIYI